MGYTPQRHSVNIQHLELIRKKEKRRGKRKGEREKKQKKGGEREEKRLQRIRKN